MSKGSETVKDINLLRNVFMNFQTTGVLKK